MDIKRMKLADLTPADYNPRVISPEAMEGLKASIARFGNLQPIIYNTRTGHVVGGHQRLTALLEAGEKYDKVVVVDLPLEEEKALNIALNNPHITGEFTEDVTAIIAELQAWEPDLVTDLRLDEILVDFEEPELDEDPPAPKDKGSSYDRQYSVAVLCDTEDEQQQVYERLQSLGYTNLKVLSI